MQVLAKKFIFSTIKSLAALLALIFAVYAIRPAQAASYDVVPAVISADPDADALAVELTVQDVLLQVCQDKGYGEDCAKTLFGILWKESRGEAKAVGDHGYAHGYFQINRFYNPGVKLECAEDLRCSAEWTLTNLERHRYPKYVAFAVQCHNGCGFKNGYAASTKRLSAKLWETPLPFHEEQLAAAK